MYIYVFLAFMFIVLFFKSNLKFVYSYLLLHLLTVLEARLLAAMHAVAAAAAAVVVLRRLHNLVHGKNAL